MVVKNQLENEVESGVKKYELRAPDGGWGYVIVFTTIVVFSCTYIPMTVFGLIFGGFLQTIGDETTGTTLSNGIFNTVNSFTGIIANGVLNQYSYRKVAFAGTLIFFIGALGVVFSQNLFQFITFFGVVQGIGFGLLLPAVLSSFNSYFVDKMAVMMSIAQCLMVVICIVMPLAATWSIETFGYRGTVVILAGLALLSFPAIFTLQPVKWHMKKVPIENLDINDSVSPIDDNHTTQEKKSLPSDVLNGQIEPLLNQGKHLTVSLKSLNEKIIHPKTRPSITSLGGRVASVTTIHDMKDNENRAKEEDLSIWQTFIKSMDMSLLKDIRYINVSVGLSLSFTSNIAFISIIPLMMGNIGLDTQDITFMVVVFNGADLVGRILITVMSGLFKFRSRILFFLATLFSAIFRTVLVMKDTYWWNLCNLAALGFLRCFIETPLTLVLSEEYQDKFASAFSLYMAVNGVISLVFGLLMSFIKSVTQSDVMVCHSLTVAFCICVITWTAEFILDRRKSKNDQRK